MAKYWIEFEGTVELNAEDEDQAEFFAKEDLADCPASIIYTEVTGVKLVNAQD